MIRLEPYSKPAQLTKEKQEELTAKYKESEKSVWQQPYIKRALLEMSHNKCCYCECKIDEESKYLEVEHFLPKNIYPDKVVEWENLLPSCKRCNIKKGAHDTGIEPIIHPVRDNPKEHLYLNLKDYQFSAKDNSRLGNTTLNVLYLNDYKRLTEKRTDIGESLVQSLDLLNAFAVECFGNGNLSKEDKERLLIGVKVLLRECIPSSEYSAAAATVLLEDEYYIRIKRMFIDNGLWNDHLGELEDKAKTCALDTVDPSRR